MSASLVGSEMCIRDRKQGMPAFLPPMSTSLRHNDWANPLVTCTASPVSYTHLTLPTICSV
eukprot:9676051-Alexandrium_andersonii.AAC.1